MLKKHAKDTSDNPVLGWGENQYTYKELNDLVQNFAENLYLKGVQKGDKIAIILNNSSEFVISYYGCMRVGAISVPINPALTSREIEVVLKDCKPRIVVLDEKVSLKLKDLKLSFYYEEVEISTDKFKELLQDVDSASINLSYSEECTILYTSGTTGDPKGAILTHNGLYHNAKVFSKAFPLDNNDRTLIVTPLTHIAALSNCLNTTIYCGGYNYLMDRWKSSSETLNTMEEQKITFFFGPPTMYTYILNDPNVSAFNSVLKYAYTGAAPLPEEIFNKWIDIFGFEIIEGYGLTECSPVVTMNPPQGKKKIGSIGLPIKDVQTKIVDDHFNEVAIGEIGELVVKGPNVMKGYLNKLTENQKSFKDGWFKTGDIAKRDEEGYLYIVDRKKDLIIRSGFNVYPREVEEVLYKHPAILEVAVVGCKDKERGELVKAVLTNKKGYSVSTDELQQYCRARLATYKVPSIIEIVDELPKNNTGKILKNKLRA